MHEYDIVLKSVIRRLGGEALELLTGFAIDQWHNVELPEVRTLRADMVGEAAQGKLVQIELQSANDPEMPLRMAEYALAIYRQFRQFPQQIVLYVGRAKLKMPGVLKSHSMVFRFRAVDIRELDGTALLASGKAEENVIAVLMRLGDHREAVRGILRRISKSEPGQREVALKELTILAGLRQLGLIIEQEAKTMPITEDIMDHDLLGPAITRGERNMVIRQMEKRFGSVPEWALQRLEAMSYRDVEETGLRLLDAGSLEDIFGK